MDVLLRNIVASPFLSTFVGLFILYESITYLRSRYLTAIPDLTPSFLSLLLLDTTSALKAANNAYHKYSKNGQLFRFHGVYVTPVQTFAEYRKLGNSVLSLSNAIDDTIFLKYFLGDDNTDVVDFVIKDVTRRIDLIIPGVHEEVKHFWAGVFPPTKCSDLWCEQTLHPNILKGVGRIACRLLAGERYAANDKFTRTAADFANGIQYQAVLFHYLPKQLLPLACKLSPIQTRVNQITDIVREDVYQYIEDSVEHEVDGAMDGEEPIILKYLVKFVQNRSAYKGADQDTVLAGTVGRFLGLMFAAIDTTTLTLTQSLFDLISHPREEYATPIKAQIESVSNKHGGRWSHQALQELTLLDSFIKESQRLHPMSVVLGTRKVMKSGGHRFEATTKNSAPVHLPEGSIVMMPTYGLHSDPSIYPDPNHFQGFRHIKAADTESKPNDQFLSFGHGRHVCPGRHLALCVVKLMTIEFMNHYDWKEMQRPEDVPFGPSLGPNPRAKITIKQIG